MIDPDYALAQLRDARTNQRLCRVAWIDNGAEGATSWKEATPEFVARSRAACVSLMTDNPGVRAWVEFRPRPADRAPHGEASHG